jgi:hypothetical protein
VIAAAVWDFPGGLVYQRIFWDTAAALDPDATASVSSWLPRDVSKRLPRAVDFETERDS